LIDLNAIYNAVSLTIKLASEAVSERC